MPKFIYSVQVTSLQTVIYTKQVCDECYKDFVKMIPVEYGYSKRLGNQFNRCQWCLKYTEKGLSWQARKSK